MLNYKELIDDAIKAPSGHNTQPWQFKLNDNEIQIHPDFSRRLPVVDSDDHALYISLGCAAENIMISAKHMGLEPHFSLKKTSEEVAFISIKWSQNENITEDELVHYIGKRQSTRNEYADKKVTEDALKKLENAFDVQGISTMRFTSPEKIATLEPFIIEGSNLQFENRAFVDELVSWIRFSKKKARQTRDGIWASSMGMPNIGYFIGSIIMKKLVSAKSEAKRWKKLIDASAGFFLFIADHNDVDHWVGLGRAFQRFALTATKLNISHAHVNMPCEEVAVRQKLAAELDISNKHPLLLIRFGYSDKMPYSFRRDSDEVMAV